MSTPHAPGTFCWAELSAHDAAAAKKFYSQLFGWQLHDDPLPSGGTYTMLQLDGGNVGAMYNMPAEQRKQGVPPHWLPYFATADAKASTAEAKKLGGKVLVDTMDVFDIGTMAVFADPQGAMFAVWQAKKHAGVEHTDARPGTFCWVENMTDDVDRAGAFHSQLHGWDGMTMDMGDVQYCIFMKDGEQKAGMMEIQPDMGPTPPHFMLYVAVADCDASATKAQKLGAQMHVPPTDIPGIGRFSMFEDPQGAMFSIITLAG